MLPPTIRRRGKIAHLPKDLRDQINQMIESHASSRKIIGFLAERGHPAITAVNITNWIKGDRAGSSGYKDWLGEREQLFTLQSWSQFASEVTHHSDGSQIHEATRLMAAVQLSQVILGFDTHRLKAALAKKPIAFASLVTALRRLSRDHLAYQKYRQLVQDQKANIQSALGAAKSAQGLTPEAVEQIRQALRLL